MKEVREEAGLEVRAFKLGAVWDRSRLAHKPIYPFHIWKLFSLCEVIGGEPQNGPETSEVAFFAEAGGSGFANDGYGWGAKQPTDDEDVR